MKSQSETSVAPISRRDFLTTAAVGGGALVFGPLLHGRSARAPASKDSGRPNILFLITDQQHWKAIGALGNPMLHTPAQDRLVREGVNVENCYCTNPVCMPSRSSLLTGRMPTETGVWVNTVHQPSGGKLEREMPNLGSWLSGQAGYESIYAGKAHLPHSNTYNLPGFRVIAAGADHRGDLGDLHVSRACEAYIRSHARGGGAKPFLMVCSLVQPHDVCHWLSINQNTRKQPWYPGLERVAPVPRLPHNFHPPEGEPSRVKSARASQQPAKGNWTEEQWRYYLWSYYRQVEMVDAEIGRVLQALDETGLADNTLIVLTSDHGEGMGEQQMVRKDFLYESATRVPLVARLPGKIPQGLNLSGTLASGLDLMPTFCDYAQIDAPSGLSHARSLRTHWEGKETGSLRECLVIEDNAAARSKNNAKLTGRKVRTSRYSYTRYFMEPDEMLFDLATDPGETRNLAGDSRMVGVLREHRRLVREWESKLTISKYLPENPWPSLAE